MLAAAILHDTIEDTSTDCDDIIEGFGLDVARWVAALTKDMRLPHDEREEAYLDALSAADWQVKVCKLADIYDNLGDSRHLSPHARNLTAANSRLYLNAIRSGLPPQAEAAFRLVESQLIVIESGKTS
jgi:(p)ppGpp synthase/HD superfamily hydrolase